MASHLRKLLQDYPGIPPGCEPFCLPLNTDGKCPSLCMTPCPFFCKTPTDNNLPPPSPTTTYHDYTTNHPSDQHDTSLTIALVVLIIHFFVLVFFCIKRTKKQACALDHVACSDASMDENHGPNQGPAAENHVWHMRTAVISEITLVKYTKGDGLIEGTECSVCLNGFEEDETLRLLPICSHAFHVPCIDTWLRSHTNCPLCRASTVSVPYCEVIVLDSSLVKENLAEILRSSPESVGEGIEDDVNSNDGNRTVERSVSVNALSCSVVIEALANDPERKAEDQKVEAKELDNGTKRDGSLSRLVGSLSTERPASSK